MASAAVKRTGGSTWTVDSIDRLSQGSSVDGHQLDDGPAHAICGSLYVFAKATALYLESGDPQSPRVARSACRLRHRSRLRTKRPIDQAHNPTSSAPLIELSPSHCLFLLCAYKVCKHVGHRSGTIMDLDSLCAFRYQGRLFILQERAENLHADPDQTYRQHYLRAGSCRP